MRRDPGSIHSLLLVLGTSTSLASIAPVPAVYIYSSSEAFNEEMAIDHQRLGHWLEHFGVESHGLGQAQDGPLHASGHASGKELVDIIRQVRPQCLVPIHTEKPQFFLEELKGEGIEVHLPKANVPLTF